ncbi:MAG TPA: tetratricopeptide repeat protein [Candidatus Polarisedimenticolaceae bacterium]|nr:tetratricopeptide repeat protein [Candidatus Polarisedimenticolaceae bacterium]
MLLLAASLLLAAATAAAPPDAPETAADPEQVENSEGGRGQKYPGWAVLYRVPQLTIVYPSAEKAEGETNRYSAERRAATLRGLTGAKVEVVADSALTEAQRQGHVLLLGWGNRVLGTKGLEKPFRHGRDAGTRFAGLTEPDPDIDLLFMVRSPWGQEKWLFFWSRIDPEMELFQSLPTVGSDWAMVDGFRVVRQGMFEGTTWPPVRDEDAEADHSDAVFEVEKNWVQLKTERYTISYDPAIVSEAELRKIGSAREGALSKAIASLGSPGPDFRVHLFLYPDEAAKLAGTGIAGAAHAIPRERELHMTKEAAATASEHEEIHLVARAVLGPSYLNVLYEGLALARQGTFGDTSLDLVAAAVLERNAWPKVAEILDDASVRKASDNRLLPAAGLLLQWVESVGGRAALGKVVSLKEGSPEAVARAVGMEPPAMETAFRQWVELRAAPQKNEIAFLKLEREAAQRHVASDWTGLIEVLERGLALKPGDPQTVFNLASARMRLKDYAHAESDLQKLIAQETARAPGTTFVVYGHYQLGRVYDLQGRRELALAEYRKVLELPDIKDSRRLAQEGIDTPFTEEALQ